MLCEVLLATQTACSNVVETFALMSFTCSHIRHTAWLCSWRSVIMGVESAARCDGEITPAACIMPQGPVPIKSRVGEIVILVQNRPEHLLCSA